MNPLNSLLFNFGSTFALFGMSIVHALNGDLFGTLFPLVLGMIQIPFIVMNYNKVKGNTR